MNHAQDTAFHTAGFDFSPASIERLAARLRAGLPGHLGIELVAVEPGQITLQMAIQAIHTAANGYLHGGAVVTLADTACGFGCIAHLPPNAMNFTTVELKSNFLRTALEGVIMAQASLRHAGSRTQIWDAEVYTTLGPTGEQQNNREQQHGEKRTLALFRCTQMVLYPQAAAKQVSAEMEQSSGNG